MKEILENAAKDFLLYWVSLSCPAGLFRTRIVRSPPFYLCSSEDAWCACRSHKNLHTDGSDGPSAYTPAVVGINSIEAGTIGDIGGEAVHGCAKVCF